MGRFTRPADVVARRLGESAVLIRMRTSRIYQLNETGARIWELLEQDASRDAVLDALLNEFDVSREDAASALDDLIAAVF